MLVNRHIAALVEQQAVRLRLKEACVEMRQVELTALSKQVDTRLIHMVQGRVSMLDDLIAAADNAAKRSTKP
jgi:hypothetical protein